MKIEKITDAQAAKMPEYVEEWVKIGLDCTQKSNGKIKAAVERLYRECDLPVPSVFVFDSPLEACIKGPWMQHLLDNGGTPKAAPEGSPSPEAAEYIKREWSTYHGGQFWASWFAYCSYLVEVLGVKLPESYHADEELAKLVSWMWLGEGFCAVSKKPLHILMDDDGRLHSDLDMAIKWKDGFGVWCIHGVRVDEQIVMRPHEQTLEQIHQEENEEVKRIRIERYGWERYLAEVDADVIDSRRNDIEATKEYLLKSGGMALLLCHCPSTARVYCLEVDPSVSTCQQAQEWLWQSNSSRYGKSSIIGRS